MYGGKIMSLGNIIADLNQITGDQQRINTYVAGLLSHQKPITPKQEQLMKKQQDC